MLFPKHTERFEGFRFPCSRITHHKKGRLLVSLKQDLHHRSMEWHISNFHNNGIMQGQNHLLQIAEISEFRSVGYCSYKNLMFSGHHKILSGIWLVPSITLPGTP